MNPGSSRRSVNVPPEKAEKTVQIAISRSEEHTSELQSRQYLVCRLLLEKKKITSHAFAHRLRKVANVCTNRSLLPQGFAIPVMCSIPPHYYSADSHSQRERVI